MEKRKNKSKFLLIQLPNLVGKRASKNRNKIKNLKINVLKNLSSHIFIIIFFLVVLGVFPIIFFQIILQKPAPEVEDERPLRIDAYFSKYNAPLAGFGHIFVREADLCGLDWRLLPAIAMQESSGGKYMQFNNPFGWGGAQIPYNSIEEAIVDVTKNLCGNATSTAKWYTATSTETKLYRYNGTVRPTYPNEVMWIMEQF